jgi:thiamine biosynthesis lipoprotein
LREERLVGNTRRLALEIGALAVVLIAIFVFVRRPAEVESVGDHCLAMGTIVNVTVFGAGPDEADSAIAAAFAEIRRVEALTTRHAEGSAVSRLNETGGTDDPEVSAIIARSIGVSEATGGAFDVTVAPVVDLWSFGPGMTLPEEDEVASALARVGYRRVSVGESGGVTLSRETAIDLDGIAKGYAVDRAVDLLEARGVPAAVVDAGGDIGLLGSAPREGGWRIGIQNPRGEGTVGVLTLDGGSVATSGDYQRCGFVDGVRYHHIIDPSTGWPARGAISVTITARRCIDADAIATAVFVLGPERGLEFVEATDGVEAVIVTGDEAVGDVLVSSGLRGRFEATP